jgi:hypothetical protein
LGIGWIRYALDSVPITDLSSRQERRFLALECGLGRDTAEIRRIAPWFDVEGKSTERLTLHHNLVPRTCICESLSRCRKASSRCRLERTKSLKPGFGGLTRSRFPETTDTFKHQGRSAGVFSLVWQLHCTHEMAQSCSQRLREIHSTC